MHYDGPIPNSIDLAAQLSRSVDVGLSTGTFTPATNPALHETKIANLVALATDLFLVLSTRETREFLSAQGKVASVIYSNSIALRSFYTGQAWKDFSEGRLASSTWRERVAFWNSLTNAFTLIQTGASCSGSFLNDCKEAVGSIGVAGKIFVLEGVPPICNVLSKVLDITRIGQQTANIFAEMTENKEEEKFQTTAQKTAKYASVLGSATALGRMAASSFALSPLAIGLGVISGICGGIKLYASWNVNAPGTELLRCKEELLAALVQIDKEVIEKGKNQEMKSQFISDLGTMLSNLRYLIAGSCQNDAMLRVCLTGFNCLKTVLINEHLISVATQKKCQNLHDKTLKSLGDQSDLAKTKKEALSRQRHFLENLSKKIDKRLNNLEKKYGADAFAIQFITDGLQNFKAAINDELLKVMQLLPEETDGLDISRWLRRVDALTSDVHKQTLTQNFKLSSSPPGPSDRLHL